MNILTKALEYGTKTNLAKSIGVSRNTIYLWLRGTNTPTEKNIEMLKVYINFKENLIKENEKRDKNIEQICSEYKNALDGMKK